MADVKWIKITTDVFDDEKILLIESLPDAYSIIVVWFKLLCLAGKQNNSGVFMMGQIAYTDKMLATIFRMKESTVTMALQTFEQFGMIEIIDGVITIPNWGKHQNLDQLESKKQYMRNYMKEYRNKQKALTQNGKLCENGLPMNEWIEVLKFFNHECAYCGCKYDLEQEHIIPVNDGGTYCIGNIVPSCRSCNASKGSKSVDGWYKKSEAFDDFRFAKLNEYRCKTNVNDLHKTNVSLADKEEDKDIDKEIYISIVEYLNSKAGTGYKATTAKTKTAIKARLAEGFTLEDFKTVIDKKCTDWLGSEYEQYLRPETLFGTKFESYLNAKIMRNPQQRKVGASGIAISGEKSDLEGVF
jgi:uncharacterized phage protein (TIGR02220 family)/predicted phage replisome organizer